MENEIKGIFVDTAKKSPFIDINKASMDVEDEARIRLNKEFSGYYKDNLTSDIVTIEVESAKISKAHFYIYFRIASYVICKNGITVSYQTVSEEELRTRFKYNRYVQIDREVAFHYLQMSLCWDFLSDIIAGID